MCGCGGMLEEEGKVETEAQEMCIYCGERARESGRESARERERERERVLLGTFQNGGPRAREGGRESERERRRKD